MDIGLKELKIELLEQERPGNYKFNGKLYATKGVAERYENKTLLLAVSLIKIIQSLQDPDYFQVAKVNDTKVWIIDSIEYVTILFPDEY